MGAVKVTTGQRASITGPVPCALPLLRPCLGTPNAADR